ncbi:MAG TPA: hypothetical protein VLG37_01175 [Candidatus Saccharimonadales bacterium]|nr:hypothetical protein [Candidatus Saccharimonadales bacterium]
MAEYGHGVFYPAELSELEVRHLLYLSQTDVTKDPDLGLQYAVAAYDKALQPEVAASDPTAAGEAAAKAGFRSEQLNYAANVVSKWFERSHEALQADDPKTKRERVATYILEGRAWGLDVLKGSGNRELLDRALLAFFLGEQIVQEQHHGGIFDWDPYAAMLKCHDATFEAMFGKGRRAARFAISAMGRSLTALPENANTPNQLATIPRMTKKDIKFNSKHTLIGLAALFLAVTKKINFAQPLRRKLAFKILG